MKWQQQVAISCVAEKALVYFAVFTFKINYKTFEKLQSVLLRFPSGVLEPPSCLRWLLLFGRDI
jgi:hypothetical protein